MPEPDALRRLAAFVNERHAVYLRKGLLQRAAAKADGEKLRVTEMEHRAWGRDEIAGRWSLDFLTDDPILRTYKFCNVYRELDRVTVWIREHIREPFADHEHLWFMLAAARYINWPDTLEELIGGGAGGLTPSWPDREFFSPPAMTKVLEERRFRGLKVETGAYMIRAESDTKAPWYSWSKQRYVAEVVLGKLWENRHDWQHLNGPGSDTFRGVWEYLQLPYFTGWGPFMAYQVVVDLRHTRYLRDAPDIQTWAALGPGSRRGLNRLHGREVDTPLSQDKGLGEMLEVRWAFEAGGLLAPWVPLPDLSDVQNCLCEFDKHERVRLGQGRPRAKYVPGRGR